MQPALAVGQRRGTDFDDQAGGVGDLHAGVHHDCRVLSSPVIGSADSGSCACPSAGSTCASCSTDGTQSKTTALSSGPMITVDPSTAPSSARRFSTPVSPTGPRGIARLPRCRSPSDGPSAGVWCPGPGMRHPVCAPRSPQHRWAAASGRRGSAQPVVARDRQGPGATSHS